MEVYVCRWPIFHVYGKLESALALYHSAGFVTELPFRIYLQLFRVLASDSAPNRYSMLAFEVEFSTKFSSSPLSFKSSLWEFSTPFLHHGKISTQFNICDRFSFTQSKQGDTLQPNEDLIYQSTHYTLHFIIKLK